MIALGTGGTVTGVGRYLKEQNPGIEIIGADPEGSIYSGGPVHPYRVEGIGEDFWPETFDPEIVDRYVTVSDRDSFLAARRLVAREGLFAGGSTGTALCAAVQVARELDDPEALVATIIPDGGRPYVSKVFNDSWMREHGYLGDEGGLTVGEVIRARSVDRPMLTVGSHDQVGRALELMREHGVSQVPVVSGDDGRAFMGTVSERGLLMASAEHPGHPRRAGHRGARAAAARARRREPGERGDPHAARRAQAGDRRRRRSRARHPRLGRPDRGAERVTEQDRLDTRVVHAGLEPDPTYGSVIPPIHQTSTFVQPAPGEFVEDYDYARSANPTRAALERALGELEGGHGAAFSSGMAATHALLTAALDAGDHLILPLDLYGGTYRLVDKVLARFGLAYDLVDQRDLDALARGAAPRDEADLGRDADQPAAQRDRRRRRWSRRPRGARWSSTTPSPPRSSSGRWSWVRPRSCTRPPSTSAGTPTSSAGP